MLTHLPSSDEVAAELSARSLSRFIRDAWPLVEPASPFVSGWHIDCVAEHLEAVSAGELRRLIINIPPRTMKSLSVAVFWPAWEWLRKPHLRWVYASYAAALAQRDSMKMRRVIKSEGGAKEGTVFQRVGYQGLLAMLHDQPWELVKDQDAKQKYETTATGMRIATSIEGIGTGEGGDRIVVDDPLNAKQARSDLERSFVNDWWDRTMMTRFNNAEASAVIVMQRLHEEDLTGHLIEKGGWHHLCLPAEYEASHPFVYPAEARLPSGRIVSGDPRGEDGELLDPVRLPAERLKELEKGIGSYGYAGQMQQRPAPAEGGMFRRGWWRRYRLDELPMAFDRLVTSWDMRFSDSKEAASSFVVGQVWGVAGADHYLLGQVRAKLGFTESVKAVEDTAAWRPTPAKLVEDKANGPAVINTLGRKVPGLIAISPEGGKEVRAAAAEPTIEAGNVWLPAADHIPCPPGYAATAVEDFVHEFTVFPNGSHDDQVDALSQALNWIANAPASVSAGPTIWG